MRTTLIIDDALLKKAKAVALRSGCTLSEVVNRALGESFAAREAERLPFEMLTYGGSGRSRHEPADFALLLEDDDVAAVRD